MKSMNLKFIMHHYFAVAITVLIFAASVCLYVFIYNKAESQIANTKDAFLAVADAQQNESKYKELSKTLASIKPDVDNATSVLIPSDQIISFIEAVEKVDSVTRANVSIVSIAADDLSNSPASTTGSVRAHIRIVGSWQSAMRSLHLVEALPYAISTNNVRAVSDAKKTWTIEFDMTAMTIK